MSEFCPIEFYRFVYMLNKVASSLKTSIANKEVLNRESVACLNSQRTLATIEITPHLVFVENTSRLTKHSFNCMRVGVVHVHPNSVAVAQTARTVRIVPCRVRDAVLLLERQCSRVGCVNANDSDNIVCGKVWCSCCQEQDVRRLFNCVALVVEL